MAKLPIKLKTIVKTIIDKQGRDITILNLKGLTITDYFIIVTADSTTQAAGIANHLIEKMKLRGHQPLGVEGMPHNNWVLVDFGDVVVHIFLPELRDLYDIENLWYDSQRYEADEDGNILSVN